MPYTLALLQARVSELRSLRPPGRQRTHGRGGHFAYDAFGGAAWPCHCLPCRSGTVGDIASTFFDNAPRCTLHVMFFSPNDPDMDDATPGALVHLGTQQPQPDAKNVQKPSAPALKPGPKAPAPKAPKAPAPKPTAPVSAQAGKGQAAGQVRVQRAGHELRAGPPPC